MFGYKSGIGIKELVFISYAGMIRGAVAFGLVLRIDMGVENRSVIVTTSLFIVVFTTVVLGSTVATLGKCLFKAELEEKRRLKALKEGHHDPNSSHHAIFEGANHDEGNEEVTPTPIGPNG